MFFTALGIVSVDSVPLWWIFRTPAVSEDLCFTGHNQTLQIHDLRFIIPLCFYHTSSTIGRQVKFLQCRGYCLAWTGDTKPL